MACEHSGSTCCNYARMFRGQWDDYYLRALTCIEHANFQQALEDFQASLERRPPSRQFDCRMVRTYGMRYLDYFPNREIGFVYYQQQQYETALEYLNKSIQSEPSAKAYYYRSKIHKKLQSTVSHPHLVISEPCPITGQTGEIWQSQMPLILKGVATDDQWIDWIAIQGKPVWIDHASPKVSFDKTLFLPEGTHRIQIQVKNIHETITEKQLIAHIDQTGPTIACQAAKEQGRLCIYAKDQSGEMQLVINQQSILTHRGSTLKHTFKWPENKENIDICVIDRCSNKTCASISKANLISFPYISGLIANNQAGIFSDAAPAWFNPSEINISLDQPDKSTVFVDNMIISGQILSERPITRVLINGKNLPIQTSKHIYFNRRIYLQPGKNIISITAQMHSGGFVQKEMLVNRKIPDAWQHKNRYGMSMYPFNINGAEKDRFFDKWLGLSQNDDKNDRTAQIRQFEAHLFKNMADRKRFRIDFRGKVNQSKSSLPNQASLLGDTYASKFGLEITTRIVDNKTSSILGVKDVYRESKQIVNMDEMAQELSEKIHRAFPLVHGEIISKLENSWQFDSQNHMPNVSWPILVYRKTDQPTIVGHGRISPRLDDLQMIIVNRGEKDIQCGDWVIAR